MNCPSCHHPAHEPGKCRGATKQIVCDCKGGEPQEQPLSEEDYDEAACMIGSRSEARVFRHSREQISALQRKLKERDELIERMKTAMVKRTAPLPHLECKCQWCELIAEAERILKEKP